MLHTYFSLSTSILMKPRILTPGFALCSSFDDILEVMVIFFLLLRIFITCHDQSKHHHFELVKNFFITLQLLLSQKFSMIFIVCCKTSTIKTILQQCLEQPYFNANKKNDNKETTGSCTLCATSKYLQIYERHTIF